MLMGVLKIRLSQLIFVFYIVVFFVHGNLHALTPLTSAKYNSGENSPASQKKY